MPRDAVKIRDLTEVVRDAKMRNRDKEDHTDEDYHLFLDLVLKMLTYEPAEHVSSHWAAPATSPYSPSGQSAGLQETCPV